MHRIRAGILLKHDPVHTAAAEQSLQAAIAIAQSQKARSFELRAVLSLAKLYRAANRDADAHTVLAPAVESFPPTQQFPELREAQTLLAALSESDAVKSAAALRQRRLHLQTSLGNALIHARGQQAPETSAAFARARRRGAAGCVIVSDIILAGCRTGQVSQYQAHPRIAQPSRHTVAELFIILDGRKLARTDFVEHRLCDQRGKTAAPLQDATGLFRRILPQDVSKILCVIAPVIVFRDPLAPKLDPDVAVTAIRGSRL
jgi:hypothetical protein